MDVNKDDRAGHFPYQEYPHTDKHIHDEVDKIEKIIHPEGRCTVCGGGKYYWRHLEGSANGFQLHNFTPEKGKR